MVRPRPPISATTGVPTARAGLDGAVTLYAADGDGFGPFAAAHVHLGVVDAEGMDADEGGVWSRCWFGGLLTRVSGGPNAEMTMTFMDMLCAGFACIVSANLVCRFSRFVFLK
ncbi:hypothetical protein J3458_002239 [Metarhizium acridum]|uniref:uncharacterized protein n=1 Tax=Metarhizium acridum TaxID=92637 RepID=UPI001C6B2786|nr:hypothetical protein J3458_002239 [Metarhizium acridum]